MRDAFTELVQEIKSWVRDKGQVEQPIYCSARCPESSSIRWRLSIWKQTQRDQAGLPKVEKGRNCFDFPRLEPIVGLSSAISDAAG